MFMTNIHRIYNTYLNKEFTTFLSFFKEINEDFDEAEVFPNHLVNLYNENKSATLKKIKSLDTSNYLEKIRLYENLFDKICKSKINLIAFKALKSVETNSTILSNLQKFNPKTGYAERCVFDNSTNISGRLIVKEGPNILTLPKRCRTIFESRFKNGKIISVDFANLEPRLCLKLTDKTEPTDLYEDIKSLLDFEIDIDRSIIKRSVISVLYGAFSENLKNISASKSKKIFETVSDYFNIKDLKEMSSSFDSLGVRRNYFGRPIWNQEETKSNIILNNYIQSTAVDIALLYFSSLINELDISKSVPVFIIHDAIVFDIENEYLKEFEDIISKGYNCEKLGHFPVTTSIFNSASKD